MGREQDTLDGGLSGDLPRVEMAEYEPHVVRLGGGGKRGVGLSADRLYIFMHIVFRVELSSVLCVVCDYSLMSEVTRAYPLLVWRVALGLPIS